MKIEVFVHKWFWDEIPRMDRVVLAASYEDEGEHPYILEHAYKIFNAPEEFLTEKEIEILGGYHRNFPSLSVGDYVRIDGGRGFWKNYKCVDNGWEEVFIVPIGEEKALG